jgi:hypothetical protein
VTGDFFSLQPFHEIGQTVAAGVGAKAQPFRIEAISVVRNGPLPQNNFELLRWGRRDILYWELSSLWDNFPYSVIA